MVDSILLNRKKRQTSPLSNINWQKTKPAFYRLPGVSKYDFPATSSPGGVIAGPFATYFSPPPILHPPCPILHAPSRIYSGGLTSRGLSSRNCTITQYGPSGVTQPERWRRKMYWQSLLVEPIGSSYSKEE